MIGGTDIWNSTRGPAIAALIMDGLLMALDRILVDMDVLIASESFLCVPFQTTQCADHLIAMVVLCASRNGLPIAPGVFAMPTPSMAVMLRSVAS